MKLIEPISLQSENSKSNSSESVVKMSEFAKKKSSLDIGTIWEE